MLRARATAALLALLCGALIACERASPTVPATPTAARAPGVSASPSIATATVAPTATSALPTVQPASPALSSPSSPPTVIIQPVATLVPPTLREVQPTEVAPGQLVQLMGYGGYFRMANGGYDESSRSFPLTFDGVEVGTVSCFVNGCWGTMTIPANATPGQHIIAAGGPGVVVTVK